MGMFLRIYSLAVKTRKRSQESARQERPQVLAQSGPEF